MKFVNPTGSTIFIWYNDNGERKSFAYSGSETSIPDNDYVHSVIEAYKFNKANWEKAGFGGSSPSSLLVERKDIRISIFEEDGNPTEYFQGNGGIPFIRWNSSAGSKTDLGVVLSPATILAHEADHALDDLTNAKAHSDRKKVHDLNYENAEEKRVITGSEQKTAYANGEIRSGRVTRRNHEGKTVYTISATSNIIKR